MMTPEDMAILHARAFEGQGRVWSAQEFQNLLASPHVFAVGDGAAFALGRVIADEAELLTIATEPSHQRLGLGRARMHAYEQMARDRGALSSFLEVAADNHAARALYAAEGYAQTGQRLGYYQRSDGPAVDALILSKSLDRGDAR